MKRRVFIALVASVPLAGCGILGGSDGVSDSLDATSEDFSDWVSESFDASEGDEIDVTIEAGGEGAYVTLGPEEDSVDEEDMMGGHQVEVAEWEVDPDESVSDTVEIEEEDTYVFTIWDGTADVEAE